VTRSFLFFSFSFSFFLRHRSPFPGLDFFFSTRSFVVSLYFPRMELSIFFVEREVIYGFLDTSPPPFDPPPAFLWEELPRKTVLPRPSARQFHSFFRAAAIHRGCLLRDPSLLRLTSSYLHPNKALLADSLGAQIFGGLLLKTGSSPRLSLGFKAAWFRRDGWKLSPI